MPVIGRLGHRESLGEVICRSWSLFVAGAAAVVRCRWRVALLGGRWVGTRSGSGGGGG